MPREIPPEVLGVAGRDGTVSRYLQDFVTANSLTLGRLDVRSEVVPSPGGITAQLKPGGSVGAVPLYAADTRRIAGGVAVRPRFGWSGIGPLLERIGWTATPEILSLPLVPGSAREVPPWVLAGPIIRRLGQLLREVSRGFRMYEEVRQQPRGQIIWQRYVTQEVARGSFHLLPCRFPELGPDLLLKSYIRWGLDKVARSLLPFCAVDPIARNLAQQAADLLFELRQVKALLPDHSTIQKLLRLHGLPSGFLIDGLQALGWLVDQRGLAGTSETDGIPWVLPMHSLFERWVEHVIRSWAREFGGAVRSARTGETLIPIRWATSYHSSLSSLQPDLVVRAGNQVIIFDAKYKGHLMELDQERWQLQGEVLREEHRHDLHQVLAYAAAFEAEHVAAVLVYPMRLATWERLAKAERTVNTALLNRGGREVMIALVGLPLEVPTVWAGVPDEWARIRTVKD